ncbi:MAG: hypothetical protein PW844_20755 [Pantoea sp.]|uniref:hypothetical protein n=1 Tax=Pantoea sp. TaxID=69393 RepID=UPI00239DFD19|nr:hypothetical protein [Pantoea sp.]MDE1188863.1 hypothetical protein [Pantoea sp.]
MKLRTETREILRQYKAVVNERRRALGLTELKTEQIVDEICEYMTCQYAVYIGGHFILQGGGQN